MNVFEKFEPIIQHNSKTIQSIVRLHGLSIDTLAKIYHHFLNQQVPFDENEVRCTAGCDYCCHLRVSASVAEVLVIVEAIKKSGRGDHYRQKIANAADTVAKRAAREVSWWSENAIPCIFLDGDKHLCSIYDVRPFSCRGYHSLDVDQCQKGFIQRTMVPIPCYPDLKRSREIYSVSFSRALVEIGLQSLQVELSSAVALFLEQPEGVARWMAGGKVFKESGK